MTRASRQLSVSLLVILTVAAAVAASIFVASVIEKGAQPASQIDDRTWGAQIAAPVGVDVAGRAHELVYDPGRRTIWAVLYAFEGDDKLVEFNLETGAARDWALPSNDVRPITAKLRVAPDGTVWFARHRTLTRLDPSSGKMSSVDLPETDPDGPKDPYDPSLMVPGTWLSALTFVGGEAVAARNNVRSLIRFDENLIELGRIALPPGFVGPKDIAATSDGTIYVTGGWDQSGIRWQFLTRQVRAPW